MFNQFLLTADEPLPFHTGMRGLFPEVSAAPPRSLANLRPSTLGLMHGAAHAGDCERALNDLANAFDERPRTAGVRMAEPRLPGE